jgi:protease-4
VVKEGRPNLSGKQVEELADGSIYTGELALRAGLIDKVGYMKDAIEAAMKLAKIDSAMVVKYKQPFMFMDVLTGAEGKTILKMDRSMVYEMSTPQLMYLWSL